MEFGQKELISVLICLKGYLPDLGKQIAIDSTVVETYANPNRTPGSDRKAAWTKVHNAKNLKGKYVYGYKTHAAFDANYDAPLGFLMTTAKTADVYMLIPLMERV